MGHCLGACVREHRALAASPRAAMGCCPSGVERKPAASQQAARRAGGQPKAVKQASPQKLVSRFPGYEMIDQAAGEAKQNVQKVKDEWDGAKEPAAASDGAEEELYGHLVSVGDYVVKSKIAVGAQASVWEGHKEGHPEEKRVVKAYSKEALQTERHDSGLVHESVWYEYVLLQRLGRGHPGIPVLDEALESSTHSYLVMELMEGIQLRTRIEKREWWRCRRRVTFCVTVGDAAEVGMSFRGVCVTGAAADGPAATAERIRGAAGGGVAAGMRVCSVGRRENEKTADGNATDRWKTVESEVVTTGEGLAAALAKHVQAGVKLALTVSEEPEPKNPEAYDPRRIFKEVADIVYYMHHHGVAHRDLKPENIVIVGTGRDAVAKLVDFGTGAQVASGEAGPRKRFSTLGGDAPLAATKKQSVLLARPVGTTSYFSPEVVQTFADLGEVADKHTSPLSPLQVVDVMGTKLQASYYRGRPYDIWSCGAILYELLANQVLFDEGVSGGWQSIDQSIDTPRALRFQAMDPGPQSLLRRCLAKKPEDRLTAEDLLKDPWMRDTDFFVEQSA